MRLFAVLLLLLSTTFAQFSKKQADGSVLVTVPLLVFQAPKERSIATPDFKVIEDGKEATILSLVQAPDSGLGYAILVDASGSQRENIRREQHLADMLFAKFREGRDAIGGGIFDTSVQFVSLSTGRGIVVKVLNQAEPGGGTALHDAVVIAARQLSQAPRTIDVNVVLFLLSDGYDNQSKSSIDAAIREAQLANVTAISIFSEEIRLQPGGGHLALKKLAQNTGGMLIWEKGSKKVQSAIDDLFAQLHNRFYLTYLAPSCSRTGAHKIEVKTTDKKLKISAPTARFDPIN